MATAPDQNQAANRLAQYVNHRAPNGPPAMPAQPQLGNNVPPQTGLQNTYRPNFTMGGNDAPAPGRPAGPGVSDVRAKYNPANGSPEAKAWQAERTPGPAAPAAPATSAAAPAAASTPAGAPQGAGYRAGATAGRAVARLLQSAGSVALPATLASTGTAVWDTPTSDYETRFGVGPNSMDGVGGFARDVGVRALGAASDLGDALTLGAAGKFLYADKQPGAAAQALAAAPAAPAAPVYAAGGAGAGRGSINPAPANPNAPLPTASPAPAASAAAPSSDVTRVDNSYSGSNIVGDITINGKPPRNGGQVSDANMAAADRLASSSGGSSVIAPSTGAGRYSAPTVAHSGNDWQARQNLKNMATAANSITNTRRWGGPGAENNPDVVAYRDAHRADLAAQSKQTDAELTTQGYNAGLDRERMAQEGGNTRAGMQERGAAARAMGQLNLGQQRLGLDAQRASGENALRSTQVRAADRMANIQDQYLGAKTDEERSRLASQIRAMNGQGTEEAWAHSPGGQVVDPKTNMLVTQPGVIYNRRTGQSMDQSGQGGANPHSDGQRLQGKDGKFYVVQNGIPVLER